MGEEREKIKLSRRLYILYKARYWRAILFEFFLTVMDHPVYSYIVFYLFLIVVIPSVMPGEEYLPSADELKAKGIWIYKEPEEWEYEIGSIRTRKDQYMTLLKFSRSLDIQIQQLEIKFHEMFPREHLQEYRDYYNYNNPSYYRIPVATLYHYNCGIHPLMYAQQLFILEDLRTFVEHELRLLYMGASDHLCAKCLTQNKTLLLNIYEFVQARDRYMMVHGIHSVVISPYQDNFYLMMEYIKKLYTIRWMWLPLGSGL